jgi:hypothetical protein
MNFKKVLLEKNLKIEELPVKLQKKITELEAINEELEGIESTTEDADEIEQITLLKFKIGSLDKDLIKSLKRFDPYMYQQRKERMAKINEEKHGKVKEQEETEEQESEEAEEQPKEVFEQKEVVAPEQFELESVPPISKTKHIKEELDKLQETVEIKPKSFEKNLQEEEVIEVEPEVEEFDKSDDTKPKKLSKGLILMGVGAFLLTWGAVNFFRERRG